MKLKKLLALTTAALMILACAACGSKDAADSTTTEPAAIVDEVADTTAAEQAPADESSEETEAASVPTEETEAAEETGAEDEEKTPETVEEIVEFYKKAAAATDKTKPKNMTKMELTSLDGGSGAIGKLISAIEPIGRKALAKNSTEDDVLPGGYENLTAADITSATAKDDGKYTTIHMNVKQQVDGMYGKTKEGSVGHAIGVLNGLQTALDEMDGVDLDTSNGNVSLTYNNAYVDVKIDNATGKIVSGTWHHTVNVKITNCVAKVSIIKATLDGSKVVIDYTVTM